MSFITSFFDDPRGMLILLLLALPGRLLALSAHEYAHARVANRCGDPTARMLGRMTLNPLKHIDVVGLLMMLFVGFGWAKPVPVNPRNFKGDYRKCDLKVSLAGITMNLILFLAGAAALYAVIGMALHRVAAGGVAGAYLGSYGGEGILSVEGGLAYTSRLLEFAPYMGSYLIQPVYGNTVYYLFEMLSYFVQINIVLAIFNLIPIPPLDGYHALNDLVLKRDLFASQRAYRTGMVILFLLAFSGVLGEGLSLVTRFVFSRLGGAAASLFSALGIL